MEDIQRFISNFDTLAFTKIPANIQTVIDRVLKLHGVLDALMVPLNAFSRGISTLFQSDPGAKLAASFSGFKDMLREVRDETTGLGTTLNKTANQTPSIVPKQSRLQTTPVIPVAPTVNVEPSVTRQRRTTISAISEAHIQAINTLVASDPGGKLAASFSKLRDMLREIRTDAAGLGTLLKNAAIQLDKVPIERARNRTPATESAISPQNIVSSAEEGFRAREITEAAAMTQRIQSEQAAIRQAHIVTAQRRESEGNEVLRAQELSRIREMTEVYTMSQRIRSERAVTAVRYEESFRRREIEETARMTQRLDEETSRRRIAQLAQSQAQIAQASLVSSQTRPLDTTAYLNDLRRAGNAPQQTSGTRPTQTTGIVQPFDYAKNQVPLSQTGSGAAADRIDFSDRALGGLNKYPAAFAAAGAAKDKFRTNVKGLKTDLDNMDISNTKLFRGLIALQIVFGSFTVGRAIGEIKSFASDLYQVGERFQIIQETFKAAAGGNIQEASHNFEVASRTSREFGTDLLTTATNFARLQAAARGSNVEGEQANIIARGASAAVAVLGSSSEHASNVIKVFTDVLSKGRVQSEELVKQFGNAVPGAFRLAAEGMGLSVTELTEKMQRGSLVAGDTAVKIAQALLKVYEDLAKANANTLKGSFTNLGSEIERFKQQILLGGAEAGLIAFFKTLTATLGDTTVIEAARGLGEVLGKVLIASVNALTAAIQFFAENWKLFTTIIIGFVATGALISLLATIGLVIIGLGGMGLGLGAILGIIAAAIAGFTGLSAILLTFGIDTEKIASSLQKFKDDAQAAFDFKSKLNINPADIPRAFNDALQSVQKEIRTFNQDVENQAQLLDLLSSGVSSLSSEYDSYSKVLDRVKALERSNKFESLTFGGGNAESIKQQVTDIFLQLERVNAVLTDAIKLQKDLDQLQQNTSTARTTFSTVAKSATAGNVSPISFELQEQYDNIVIPALRRLQEQLRKTTDPAQAKALIDNFDNFSKSVQRNVVGLRQAQDAMRALVGITEDFRALTLEQDVTNIQAAVRVSTEFTKSGSDLLKSGREFVEKYASTELKVKPPEIRTFGNSLQEGFDPAGTGQKMGQSFVEVFTKALEGSLEKLKALFPQISVGAGGTSPGTPGAAQASSTAVSRFSADQKLVYETALASSAKEQFSGPQTQAFLGLLAQESRMGDTARFGPDLRGDKRPDGTYRSYGAGQMGAGEAQAMGYNPEQRKDLKLGTEMSAKYFATILKEKGGDTDRALLRYNGGGDPDYLVNVRKRIDELGITVTGAVEKVSNAGGNISPPSTTTVPQPPTAKSTPTEDAAYRKYITDGGVPSTISQPTVRASVPPASSINPPIPGATQPSGIVSALPQTLASTPDVGPPEPAPKKPSIFEVGLLNYLRSTSSREVQKSEAPSLVNTAPTQKKVIDDFIQNNPSFGRLTYDSGVLPSRTSEVERKEATTAKPITLRGELDPTASGFQKGSDTAETVHAQATIEAMRKRAEAVQDVADKQKMLNTVVQSAVPVDQAAVQAAQDVAAAQAVRKTIDAALLDQLSNLTGSIEKVTFADQTMANAREAGERAVRRQTLAYGDLTDAQKENAYLTAGAGVLDRALRQTNALILGIDAETQALKIQNSELSQNNMLREINIDKERRRQAFVADGVATPKKIAEFTESSERLAQEQVNAAVGEQSRGLKTQEQDLRLEIDALKYNASERSANTEANKEFQRIQDLGTTISVKARQALINQVEAVRALKLEYEKANGPIQQYIDSIGTLDERLQGVAANGLRSVGDAFAQMAATGKVDFKNMVQSILGDVSKMIFELTITKPLLEGVKNAPKGGGPGGLISSIIESFSQVGKKREQPSTILIDPQAYNTPIGPSQDGRGIDFIGPVQDASEQLADTLSATSNAADSTVQAFNGLDGAASSVSDGISSILRSFSGGSGKGSSTTEVALSIAAKTAAAYIGSSGGGADFASAGPSDTGGGGSFATGGWISDTGYIHHFSAGGPVGMDNIPAILSPGEMVLNKSQQKQVDLSPLSFASGGFVTDTGAIRRFAGGGPVEREIVPSHMSIINDRHNAVSYFADGGIVERDIKSSNKSVRDHTREHVTYFTDGGVVKSDMVQSDYSFREREKVVESLAVGGWVGNNGMIYHFAVGGAVGNDTIPVTLSPGEMVLNKEQQKRVDFSRLGPVQQFATGGAAGKNTVRAMLSPGEVVLSPSQARQVPKTLFTPVHMATGGLVTSHGSIRHFAGGGLVGDDSLAAMPSQRSNTSQESQNQDDGDSSYHRPRSPSVTVNIATPDIGNFRRSKDQVAAEMLNAASRARRIR